MPVVHTQDLTKHYGRKIGCEKVCLSVSEGHIFGFLGPNGAGKSTFVKMMMGLIHPTSGHAELLGEPVGLPHVRTRVGFLPEVFRYQSWLTPNELLRFHGRLLGMESSAVNEAAPRVLEDVGIGDEGDAKIKSFSKGMQQRFGLACALLSDPEVIFLDEPTSALDPLGRRHVRELLTHVRDRGATVFLNSHLLSEVEMVCDEVAVIDQGRVLSSGSLSEMLSGPCEVEVSLVESMDPTALASDLPPDWRLLEADGKSLLFGVPDEIAIPALVDRLVAVGARIAGVQRRKRTLEALFIETLGEAADDK